MLTFRVLSSLSAQAQVVCVAYGGCQSAPTATAAKRPARASRGRRNGREGAIEGDGRADASRMIANSHDQLARLVMVSGSSVFSAPRPALPDIAVEATCTAS